jgi:hypothetical protein
MQEGTSKDLPHWEQRGLGPGLTLHRHGLHDVQTRLLFHFSLYFLFFGRHPIPPSSIIAQMDQVVYLNSLAIWVRFIAQRVALFKRVMLMAMENLSITQHQDTLRYAHTQGGSYKLKVRQFDVGDFVYLQQQPNDTLDIFSNRIILRIKAIKPLGVLELQGTDGRTI